MYFSNVILHGRKGTLGHTRWTWGEIWKVISHENFALDVTSSMSQGQMMIICKIFPLYTFQMSSRMDARSHLKSHLASTSSENFGVLGHARWMQSEIWKVILHAPCMSTLLLDVSSSMSQGQMMKICKIFPLYTFQMSSRMDARSHLKSHLTSTSHENFGVLGHARWTQGEIWKVILRAPRMRTLLLDVTSLMSQGQMMRICKIFPLYTFQMSSHVDTRWHLKSHLASTLPENCGVLGHARWVWGEIWKVISCAPHVRTLVWWHWHLVMLDGCEVKFEKSSRVRTFPLYTFQMSSHVDARWHL